MAHVCRMGEAVLDGPQEPQAISSSAAGLQPPPIIRTEHLWHEASPTLSVGGSQQQCWPQHFAANVPADQPTAATRNEAAKHEEDTCRESSQPRAANLLASAAGALQRGPSTALDPAAAQQHRQSYQAASEGPKAAATPREQHSSVQTSSQPESTWLPFSWGQRKPRTRNHARQTDASTSDLAAVAAAAAAEAEQAAASAAARAKVDFDEAASQSGTQLPSKRGHSHSSRQQQQNLKFALQAARVAFAPQHRPRQALSGSPDPSSDPQRSVGVHPNQKSGHKSGPRSGRNHHRAGASPTNLNKSMGYIGSNYLGVNGVRHGLEFPLRWRAGTWDPQVKKTVYIGSYDTELGAAQAVDAWHVSQGRAPVNFAEPAAALQKACSDTQLPAMSRPVATQAAAAVIIAEPSDCKPLPAASHAQRGEEGSRPQPAASDSLDGSGAQTRDIYHAASLLNSMRPLSDQDCHGADAHTISNAEHWRPHLSHAGNKSQRQSAARALVANAVGRSKSAGIQKHPALQSEPVRNASNCRGVACVDGNWHTQIKVAGDMQDLGCFENKEAAVQAYTIARRQKLLMHVA